MLGPDNSNTQFTMTHPKNDDYNRDPDTPINVPKAMKKSVINWAIPFTLGLIGLGFLALGKAQVNGMLSDYQTKSQATADRNDINKRVDEYTKQMDDMRATLYLMDKKLDHLEFIINYNQEHGKVINPSK
jgi:hypothetical protein